MATLNRHAASRARTTAVRNGEKTTEKTAPTRSARRRHAAVPQRRVAFGIGMATVCSVALVNLMAGQPATATVEPTGSVAVAQALGIDSTQAELPAAEPAQALGQLAASRAERDADQATAALLQSRAEQAAAAAKAEAERWLSPNLGYRTENE